MYNGLSIATLLAELAKDDGRDWDLFSPKWWTFQIRNRTSSLRHNIDRYWLSNFRC